MIDEITVTHKNTSGLPEGFARVKKESKHFSIEFYSMDKGTFRASTVSALQLRAIRDAADAVLKGYEP